MNLFSKAAVIGAAMLVALPAASMAGTATGNIQVTANVTSNCTLQVNPLAFGAYDPLTTNATTDLTGTTNIGVTCTMGASPQLSVAAANGNTATGGIGTPVNAAQASSMALVGGTAASLKLGYTFALSSNTNANAGGISQPFSFPLNGVIAHAQDVANGSYADQLVATVSF